MSVPSPAPHTGPTDLPGLEEAWARGGGVFFGTRWDAPAFDDAVQVATPVGRVCLFCTEVVTANDSGTFTHYLGADGAGGMEAVHIECWLRSMLGCVSHLRQQCSCYGGTEHEGTSRADARASMEWLVVEKGLRS